VEGVLVAFVLVSTAVQPGLMAYLAVPPVVAGIRHGIVTTTNTVLLTGISAVATVSANPALLDSSRLTEAAPWLAAGFGVGILASWQSRSLRLVVAQQAPFVAAHELMTKVHDLARRDAAALNTTLVAQELDAELVRTTGALRSTVMGGSYGGEHVVLAATGDAHDLATHILTPDHRVPADIAVIPIRSAETHVGVAVLQRDSAWPPELLAEAQRIADQVALRIDTAMLFDDVRHLTTAEERTRIAREMHDGVAQELVGLGYLVDEIASTTAEEPTQKLARSLRLEVSRVVSELRHSIFDLRLGVTEHRLSGALAEYVREVTHGTDLQTHLVVEDSGPSLPPRVATEVLRIAQEAIGNSRRHAQANNLWVSFVSDGSSLRLVVEDDGIGNAVRKSRHWGLQTMEERAASIAADLSVQPRAGGGTIVCLQSRGTREGKPKSGHHSTAR
jgi:signal transduction histidine kinase